MNHVPPFLLLAVTGLPVGLPAQESRPTAGAIPATPLQAPKAEPPLWGFEVEKMDGKACKLGELGGKVLLLVNTASQCGLTPQYEGLEKLQQTYADRGFTVLAFPANDFGRQEPGTNDEIAKFCQEKYSVTFPVLAKITVKGEGQAPLYKWLTTQSPFPGEVQWNFQKYLVDRSGQVVARFHPRVKPGDPKVTAAIEAALAAPVPLVAAARGAVASKAERVGGPTAGADALVAARKQAAEQDKVVFVNFSGDACPWCKKLEALMERPEINPIFEQSFVHVRIDTSRMADGQALQKEHARGQSTGIPFMTWMSPGGEILARSFDAQGKNIGYPASPAEIAAFMDIFVKVAKKATPEQTALLRKTLEELGSK